MRKAIIWVLIALMALQSLCLAEAIAPAAATVAAVNGMDAVRTASDVYLAVPAGDQQMLVRVPLGGGEAICVDRADSFDGMLPYSGGLAYLKTTAGSSAIMQCMGNEVTTIYSFGSAQASDLASYAGKLLVLMNGELHSIEPATQLCLKLSGAQMLDYVLGEGCAYYLSGGDLMEYTAQLQEGATTKQAGCIYRLDLNSGETTLLLKSGGEDLKILDHNLYFHNLADAYAVRSEEEITLMGRAYSLDVQLKTLNQECTEPDSGFWPMDKGLVTWYNGALNLDSEAGVLALYTPESGAVVASDGAYLYVWEAGSGILTQLQSNGSSAVLSTSDLSAAMDAALITPEPTFTPEPTIAPAAVSDQDTSGNAAWFDQFLENTEKVNNGGSSSSNKGNVSAQATPIGWTTPTPAPTQSNTLGSVGGYVPETNTGSSTGSSNTGSSSGSSSSGSNSSTGNSFSTSIKYLQVTGNSVNIRSKAGMNGKIIATATKGMVLKCSGTASKDSNGLTWYKVSYNGNTGWISSKYVKKTSSSSSSSSGNQAGPEVSMSGKYVKIVNGNVTLRAKPNKTSSALNTISKGTTVTFKGKASTDSRGVVWFKVSYKGQTGWISSAYGKITDSAGNSSGGSTSTSGDKVKIVGGNATIRASANKNSDKLGFINEGKTATYLGSAKKDSRGIVWYKVKYNGVTGWVSSMYSKLV